MAKRRRPGFSFKKQIRKKRRPIMLDLDSYTIQGSNNVVRVGDCVLFPPQDTSKPPRVARIEKIEVDNSRRDNVKVQVRWFYRPEDSIGGRRRFHGSKELFLSDDYAVQSAHTIQGKCIVHTFKSYTKLENINREDYYCRFEYKAATGAFAPDRVAVQCKCEMPYNPDELMMQCEGCKDWYHPSCVDMSIEEALKLDHFVCSQSCKDDVKTSHNGSHAKEPKKKGRVAFKGGLGRFLGSSSNSRAPKPTNTTPPNPTAGVVVDESLPSTSMLLMLADGTNMRAHFHLHHTVDDIRAFINASRPGSATNYQLLIAKNLADPKQTIEQACLGLANANCTIIQKF